MNSIDHNFVLILPNQLLLYLQIAFSCSAHLSGIKLKLQCGKSDVKARLSGALVIKLMLQACFIIYFCTGEKMARCIVMFDWKLNFSQFNKVALQINQQPSETIFFYLIENNILLFNVGRKNFVFSRFIKNSLLWFKINSTILGFSSLCLRASFSNNVKRTW